MARLRAPGRASPIRATMRKRTGILHVANRLAGDERYGAI